MATNLGELGDLIYAKREEIAAANAKVKELEAERNALEARLLGAMQEAGTDIVRGQLATISISETVRPQLADWSEFERFVLRKKALSLFERRIAANAYREMKDNLGGKPIPGVSEFVQVRLNVRHA
jgi:hypothetical protein